MSQEASGIPLKTLIGAALAGRRVDLRSAFHVTIPSAGMPDGDDGDDGDDGGDGGGDDDGDDGSGGDDDPKSKPDDIKDPDKKRLSDEAAANRVKAKEAQAALDAALKRIKEFEDKDKGELEKAQGDLQEATAKLEKANAALEKNAVELAFFRSGAASLFVDADAALQLLDLSEIKPDEDGVVDKKAVREAADALLKEKAWLAAKGDDDDDGKDDLPNSGKPTTKKKSGELDVEALAKKFPALRR